MRKKIACNFNHHAMNIARLTPLDYAIILAIAAALGLSIYNMVTARKLDNAAQKAKSVLVAHHNILDHAEFKGLDAGIKKYYAEIVKRIMPEMIAEANNSWKKLPARYKDISTISRVSARVRDKLLERGM